MKFSDIASFLAHELDSIPLDADRDTIKAKVASDVVGYVIQRANEVPDQEKRDNLLSLLSLGATVAKVVAVRKATKKPKSPKKKASK